MFLCWQTTDEVSDVLDSDEGLDLAMAQKLESSVSGRQKRKSMNFKSKAFSKYKWPVNKPIPYKLDSNISTCARLNTLGYIHVGTF